MNLEYDMVELQRRVANLVMFGTVMEIDAERGSARVKIGELETASLPWLSGRMGNRKDWAAPAVGEQVMVVCHNGDPAQGIIVASLGCTDNPRPSNNPRIFKTVFTDGSSVQVDLDTKEMRVVCAGSISVSAVDDISAVAGGNATMEAAGNINAGAGGSATVEAAVSAEVSAPLIQLTGNVAITGTLDVGGATTLMTTTVEGVPLHSPNNLF